MKKRILSTLLAGLLLAPAFVSCINDDSKEFGSVPMAQIQLQSELQEQYDKEKMETLSLTAPDITQAPLQKDVSYTWEIGGKVVSTDKKLDYVCEDSGTFPGRLTIKNADNTVYRQFTVKVHFPYEEGVYALATRDGKSVVTYVSERFKGEKVVYDAFGAENLEVSFPLGKEPTAFYYLNTRRFTEGKVSKEASLFYIATKNPNKFYRVQADSMIVKKSFNEVSYGSPVTAVIDDWKADTEFQHGSGYVLIKQGNRIWAANYESQGIGNFGVGQEHLAGTEIDDKLLVTATQTLYNRDGVVVFDKKKGALFGFNDLRKFSYYNELGDYDYLGSFAGTRTLEGRQRVPEERPQRVQVLLLRPGSQQQGRLYAGTGERHHPRTEGAARPRRGTEHGVPVLCRRQANLCALRPRSQVPRTEYAPPHARQGRLHRLPDPLARRLQTHRRHGHSGSGEAGQHLRLRHLAHRASRTALQGRELHGQHQAGSLPSA